MGSPYIDRFNDIEAYHRLRAAEATLQNSVPPSRYARRVLFTNDFVRSVANTLPSAHHRNYLRSPRFNGIWPHIGNDTTIDRNRHGAMEGCWVGGFKGVPLPYADYPRCSDAHAYFHATLSDRSLPSHMDRSQLLNNAWLPSPRRYYYEEVENNYNPHYALDNLTPSERWESVGIPGQHYDGLGDSLAEFANDFTTRGFGLHPESTQFGFNVKCEAGYGEEITGPEYPSDFNYSEIAFDHVSGAWFPYTDPAASTDPQACEHRSPSHRSYGSAFSPPLQPQYHGMSKRLKRQVQSLLKAAFLFHKQRLQLKREKSILRSKKQELNDQWRDLQRERERIMPGQENRPRDSCNEYDSNLFSRDREWDSDHITYEKSRNNRTPSANAKSSRHARFGVEDDKYDDYLLPDNFVGHEEYNNQYPHLSLPSLSHAAVNEAKARLQTYESAWSAIISSTEATSAQIPYPSSTLHPADLLSPSPSYIHFLMLAPEHSSVHIRIQFHALAFYLHPFGLQPRLVPLPPQKETEEPGRETPGPLEVIGLRDIERGTLEQIKSMIDNEVAIWHEDKLRLQDFSKVLDDESPVWSMDGLLDEYPDTPGDKRRRRGTHGQAFNADAGKNIKEKDLVHGVWAAVNLLRGLVRKEIKKRREL